MTDEPDQPVEIGSDGKPKAHHRTITYILAGNDPHGVLDNFLKDAEKRKDVVIIHSSDFPCIEDAVKQIKPPANVLMGCHGGDDGSFDWAPYDKNKGLMDQVGNVSVNYDDFFKQLQGQHPKGIGCVAGVNCFGETMITVGSDSDVQHMLQYAPAGTVIVPMSGNQSSTMGFAGTQFEYETHKVKDPATYLLEALDNVNPKGMITLKGYFHDIGNTGLDEMDPAKMLPSSFGIGGNPPTIVKMDDVANWVADAYKEPEFAKQHAGELKDAVKLVHRHFDARDGSDTELTVKALDKLGINGKEVMEALMKKDEVTKEDLAALNQQAIEPLKKLFPHDADKITPETVDKYLEKVGNAVIAEENKKLSDQINSVVEKMKHGEPIAVDKDGNPDFDELRIRRALGVAYLKTSGALDQMIEFTKHQQASIDVVDQQIHQTTPKPMTLEDKSFQQAAADQQQPVQTNQTPATAEPAKPAEHPAQTSPAEPAPPAQQPATPAQPATAAVAHAEDHSVAQTSGHHDFDIGNLVPTQVGGKGGRNTGAARYT